MLLHLYIQHNEFDPEQSTTLVRAVKCGTPKRMLFILLSDHASQCTDLALRELVSRMGYDTSTDADTKSLE